MHIFLIIALWIQFYGSLFLWLSVINSLWPSNTIRGHRSESTLAQVMACCMMAPNYYLNQCSLLSSEVLRQSPESNSTPSAQASLQYHEFENDAFKITLPRANEFQYPPPVLFHQHGHPRQHAFMVQLTDIARQVILHLVRTEQQWHQTHDDWEQHAQHDVVTHLRDLVDLLDDGVADVEHREVNLFDLLALPDHTADLVRARRQVVHHRRGL